MVWILRKDEQQIRCEVGYGDAPARDRITITGPERNETVEEVVQPAALIERTLAVMNDLRDRGWRLA